jgi:hypothetical protein
MSDYYTEPDSEIYEEVQFIKSYILKSNTFYAQHHLLCGMFMSDLEDCIPKLKKIEYAYSSIISAYYYSYYTDFVDQVVMSTMNRMITYLNKEIESISVKERIPFLIDPFHLEWKVRDILDTMYLLGKFRLGQSVKRIYDRNLEDIKSVATNLRCFVMPYINPEEILKKALNNTLQKIDELENKEFLQSEINNANEELRKIKKWRPFRSNTRKIEQIKEQENFIFQLSLRSEIEKKKEIDSLKKELNKIQDRLHIFNI